MFDRILAIFIVTISMFTASTVGFVVFDLIHTSENARIGEITGFPVNIPKPGENLIVNWITDPMPYCDTSLSYYVRNTKSNIVIFLGSAYHTAWGHTNFVNGPNNSYVNGAGKVEYSVFNSVITELPVIMWPGKWAYRMEFQFYCNVWSRLFPNTKSVEPFIFEIIDER